MRAVARAEAAARRVGGCSVASRRAEGGGREGQWGSRAGLTVGLSAARGRMRGSVSHAQVLQWIRAQCFVWTLLLQVRSVIFHSFHVCMQSVLLRKMCLAPS